MDVILYIVGALLAPVVGYILFLAVCALLVDPKKEYKTHSRFYRSVLNGATAMGLKLCRIKYKVTGMEKIPQEGRFMLVSNHRSKFDPLVTWHLLNQYDLAFISKSSNFKVFIFGRLIRRCCFMAIDRKNAHNAYGTVQDATDLLLTDQTSVAVYPEGTRNWRPDHRLLPFHSGLFMIAQNAHVPVVVLTVRHTEKVVKNFPWKRTYIEFDILETLSTDYVENTPRAQISQHVKELMGEHLGIDVDD